MRLRQATSEVADRVFVVSGVEDKVTLIPGWSRQIELPEPADVLVSEIIGNEPFEEEILETTLDARRRLLKPGARLIPYALTLLARPLLIPDDEPRQRAIGHEAIKRWRRLYGMEFHPLLDAAIAGPVNMPAEAEVVARWPPVVLTTGGSHRVRYRFGARRGRSRRRSRRGGQCRRGHLPSCPARGDRPHSRSVDVAHLELGDVGVGASRRGAARGPETRCACSIAAGSTERPTASRARSSHVRRIAIVRRCDPSAPPLRDEA